VDLPLGQVVAGDFREPGGHLAAGKKRGKHLYDAWSKAQGSQVLLVDAEIAANRDGGQKFLERLVLLPLKRLFAIFSLLQTEVVLEAETDGVVQRELEGLIADRMGGDAAKKRVGGGGRVGGLRRRSRSSEGS
jgi:hypothetical protein